MQRTAAVAFLGIRYAEPPIGSRRFLPPQPIRQAAGAVDATRPGAAPAQAVRTRPAWSPGGPIGETSEDCLTLNIWTPAVDAVRRPTVVHVFGGGFQNGSAYDDVRDAEALAAAGDVVVVRVNFRLGAFGFLHLGDAWGSPYQAGNVALLDLVAALEWVNANIRSLGGDPDNVTLLGLSSGAFMVAALFGVPTARGLYHRVFLKSGSASRIIERTTAEMLARDFLSIVGVEVGDRRALEALSSSVILDAQTKVVSVDLGERNAPGGRTLGIVDDGTTLVSHPLAALEGGQQNGIAMVLGVTRDEARLWFSLGVMKAPASESELVAEMVRFVGDAKARSLLSFYRATEIDTSLGNLRERFLTDAVYRVPAWQTAKSHADTGGKAYLYDFAWTPPFEGGRLGAAHGFDEPFLWGVSDVARVPFVIGAEAEAAALSRAMRDSLLRFARTGDPGWPRISDPKIFHVFGDAGMDEIDRSAIIEAWSKRD